MTHTLPRRGIAFGLCWLLSPGLVSWAAVFTFDGHSGANTNWTTGTNWAGNVAPTSGSANLEVFLDSSAFSVFSSNQNIVSPFELQTLSMDVGGSHVVSGSPLKFSNLGAAPEIRNNQAGPSPGVLYITNNIVLDAGVTVDATSQAVQLDGVVSGAGGVTKEGSHNLFYSGAANTYAGLTRMNGGTVYLQKSAGVISIPGDLEINNGGVYLYFADDQIATTSNVTINGGFLYLYGSSQTLPGLTMTGGSVGIDSFQTLTLTGNVTKNAGSNAFISGGTLNLGGAVRQFSVADSMSVDAVIANGGINKTGTGTLSITGANTYVGGTTVTAGTLSGNTNSLLGNIANSGTVQFDQFFSGTYNGVISGTGGMSVSGSGVVTLGAAQTYTGTTSVSFNTLATSASEQIDDSSNLQLSNGTLALGTFSETVGSVTASNSSITGSGTLTGTSYTLSGSGSASVALAGSGSLTKNGSGTWTLSGANSYMGGTFIDQGQLTLSGNERLLDTGQVTLGTATTSASLSVAGTETVGAVTVVSGSLTGGGTVTGTSYAVQTGGASVNLSGSGALTKNGAGMFQLSQSNAYSGGTFVNAGTLQVNANGALPAGGNLEVNGGDVANNATQTIGALMLLTGNINGGTIDATSYDVRSGSISTSLTGTGAMTKTTAGTVSLTGGNSYSGGTTVTAGVLAGNPSGIQGAVANSAIVRFDAGSGTFTGAISGPGSVEVVGAAVTFTGANTYGGGTTVMNGLLTADTTTLPGDVALSGSILDFNQAANGTFAGNISGSGNLQKFGAGELTLSGTNTYSQGTLLLAGGLALGSNSAIGGGALTMSPGTSLRAEGAARNVANTYTFSGPGLFVFSGSQNLTLSNSTPLSVATGQTLRSTNTGTTTIDAPVTTAPGSVIHAAGGNFVLGDPTSFSGYQGSGSMQIDSGATLTLRSAGFVDLSTITTLSGGTLAATNGVALGAGENLVGDGAVNAKVAAQIGSVIAATTGDLAVGSAASVSGFFSDGELRTNQYTVTVNDANTAVLGSLTTLGNGALTGSLVAGNANVSDTYSHLLVEQGKNLVGRGNVAGHVKNHGDVIGDGPAAGQRIVFDATWTVTGKGTFTNTTFLGTFSPGESPGVVGGENLAFEGSVLMELGGLTPGSGPNHHDQVNDAGLMAIGEDARLRLSAWNHYLPSLGDEFVLMTWADGLVGAFSEVLVDPWFAQHDIGFELRYNSQGAGGSLSALAVESADYNADGWVNGGDFAIWKSEFGSGADGRGFLAWQRQVSGGSAGGGLTGVPEPTSLGLAVVVALACGMGRRRR